LGVSVTERTREIGLRKAVGAQPQDILSQFLIEAVILSLFGGIIGVTIGYLGSLALSLYLQTAVPLWAVMLGLGFSTAVGIVFGVIPAIRASRLEPIEALRHE
jgi:putative ABC transport system permease protein